MRILLSTIGSRGDVQPLVALALHLRARGDEARFCVPPDFREWIEGLGFPVTPIGPELRKMTAAPAPSGPLVMPPPEVRRQLAEGTIRAQFTTVGAAAGGCDVIVAASALQVAARSVAEHLGIGYVFAAYSPNVLPSPHHAPPPLPPEPGEKPLAETASHGERWARHHQHVNALFGPALNGHRATLGLPLVDDLHSHMFTNQPWLAADPTLGPWPDPADGAVFQPGAWILSVDRPRGPDVEAFLDAGAPPVYFGFGSIRAPHDLSQVMIQTARALGRRAIVSRGWADLSLVDDQRDCLAIGDANLQALFPRVAAVVHHGGAGTTAAAALAGVPQVVIPQIYDQHYWAGRVHELGIGVAHAAGAPTVESLTVALEGAQRAEVATRARALATRIRLDGAEIAARRLRDRHS